ncbi:endonuclease/exonuclease/phosphatase family protein [Rhodobacter sp.]
MRKALSLLAILAALPVLGGYLGMLHPLGDSLAVFRLQGAGALALLSAFAWRTGAVRLGRIGMLIAFVAGAPLVWSYGSAMGPEAGQGLRIYQKNMLFRNDDLAGLAQDIRDTSPDAVMLQEVSTANLDLMADLKSEYPHQLRCDFASVGGTALVTRLQPVEGQQVCTPGLAALRVQGPQGPLWLVSIHLHWPWPYGQPPHVQKLLPMLQGLEGPVVMAGDFNMVRWSWALSAMAGAARVTPAGPVQGTYTGFAPWLTLPIDHVFAPAGGKVETRPGLGSDHLGLLAEVGL